MSLLPAMENSNESEIPRLAATLTVILATFGFFANILVLSMTLMVKQTFWYQLLQLHQLFTLIINVVHMLWIPYNYNEDKQVYSFLVKNRLSDSVLQRQFLVTGMWQLCRCLTRYLETRKREKLMEHPNKVIAIVCGVGLIPCILFPFRCSRPYLSLCTMSLEQYHRVCDSVCYSHSIVVPILMALILVVLPTVLDCLTFYNLNKEEQQLGSRRTHQAAMRIRQTFLGLFLCAALHVIHTARLAFYFYSNYAALSPTIYFLMNTIIWLGQHLTESLICAIVAGMELIQQKQILERWKRIPGTG